MNQSAIRNLKQMCA